MTNNNDALVTKLEIEAWMAAAYYADIPSRRAVVKFSRELTDAFGEREFSSEATELLYDKFPRTMAKIELGWGV